MIFLTYKINLSMEYTPESVYQKKLYKETNIIPAILIINHCKYFLAIKSLSENLTNWYFSFWQKNKKMINFFP